MEFFGEETLVIPIHNKSCCSAELQFNYKYGSKEGNISIGGPYYYCMGFLFTEKNSPLNAVDLTDMEKEEFLRSIEESRLAMLSNCKGCWAYDEVLSCLETKQLKKCPDDILSMENELKNCEKDSPDFEYLSHELPQKKRNI
jgi:hypothetical protein